MFTLEDLDDLFLIRSDPEVMRFITGVPSTKEQALAALTKHLNRWQAHGFGHWAVRFKNDPRLLGWCGLDFLDTTPEIEVGYGLARSYWGLGISTEAARASLEYGFEHLHLERIVAVAYPENAASRHVMEKLGMMYVKNGSYYGGDLVYYEISRADFPPGASNCILRDNC
ncbi:MAG: GNAT family N-acetyltransferase [Acidobacteriota bacterium]|nr:GNAT family N-acetyltransferase [Acidobacteriota bacterium]